MDRKVLVIDDEEVIRKTVRIILGRQGYQVSEASDGEEATEKLKNERFDLVISDIMMPRKSGWEVLRATRSDPRNRDIPVILLTGKTQDEDMFKGYEDGASYYICKPFTKAQLTYGVQLMFGEEQEEESPVIDLSMPPMSTSVSTVG